MGMPFEMNWLIVTKNKAKRLEENIFHLEKEGYRIYPLGLSIDVAKTKLDKPYGSATIKKMTWENGNTYIYYELLSLNNTN